jgi:hypothetical protein
VLVRSRATDKRRRFFTFWANCAMTLALVSTVSFGLISAPTAAVGLAKPSVALHSCVVAKHAARCGTLMVPEDRLSGTGRQIQIGS